MELNKQDERNHKERIYLIIYGKTQRKSQRYTRGFIIT